jgi:hypothetical protein
MYTNILFKTVKCIENYEGRKSVIKDIQSKMYTARLL